MCVDGGGEKRPPFLHLACQEICLLVSFPVAEAGFLPLIRQAPGEKDPNPSPKACVGFSRIG